MSETNMKVTDKRMFTPDGQLKDEYRFLDEHPAAVPGGPAPVAPGPAAAPQPAPPAAAVAESAAAAPTPRLEIPAGGPGLPRPTFFDLAAVLADSVSVYLGDVELPDGRTPENLEMARLYIDLLEVLREKTTGNLGAQEASFLEELLYRLRLRYVQKRG